MHIRQWLRNYWGQSNGLVDYRLRSQALVATTSTPTTRLCSRKFSQTASDRDPDRAIMKAVSALLFLLVQFRNLLRLMRWPGNTFKRLWPLLWRFIERHRRRGDDDTPRNTVVRAAHPTDLCREPSQISNHPIQHVTVCESQTPGQSGSMETQTTIHSQYYSPQTLVTLARVASFVLLRIFTTSDIDNSIGVQSTSITSPETQVDLTEASTNTFATRTDNENALPIADLEPLPVLPISLQEDKVWQTLCCHRYNDCPTMCVRHVIVE